MQSGLDTTQKMTKNCCLIQSWTSILHWLPRCSNSVTSRFCRIYITGSKLTLGLMTLVSSRNCSPLSRNKQLFLSLPDWHSNSQPLSHPCGPRKVRRKCHSSLRQLDPWLKGQVLVATNFCDPQRLLTWGKAPRNYNMKKWSLWKGNGKKACTQTQATINPSPQTQYSNLAWRQKI